MMRTRLQALLLALVLLVTLLPAPAVAHPDTRNWTRQTTYHRHGFTTWAKQCIDTVKMPNGEIRTFWFNWSKVPWQWEWQPEGFQSLRTNKRC